MLFRSHLGTLHLLALPGEVFPESSIGREAFEKDWGGEWGTFSYPAMTGWREKLPAGHLLMEIGLANNEIGYIVPKADFQPNGHPNYYCEDHAIGEDTETILRGKVEELLGAR